MHLLLLYFIAAQKVFLVERQVVVVFYIEYHLVKFTCLTQVTPC